jgi:hypothetical protein
MSMTQLKIGAVLVLTIGVVGSGVGDPTARLSVEEFQKLHTEVRPPKDEVWRTIPWKLSLLEAQRLAATEQKPIFVWAMAGNPLACV